MGHHVRVVSMFRRGDKGCEKGYPRKKEKEREPDNSRRVTENFIKCELEFAKSWVSTVIHIDRLLVAQYRQKIVNTDLVKYYENSSFFGHYLAC